MKIKLTLITLFLFVISGCSESITYDKEKYPDSGIVVFIGYDSKKYFVVNEDYDIVGDNGGGYIQIEYKPGVFFTTNDVYYKYDFKNKKELNDLLKKEGFKVK